MASRATVAQDSTLRIVEHLLRRLRIAAIEEGDIAAFAREALDDRASDAPAAAGDDHHLAGETGFAVHRVRSSGSQPEIANPPSTTSVWPLIIAASGRHSRYTALATSSGVSVGPAGVRAA